MPRFTHGQSSIMQIIYALAVEYRCIVRVRPRQRTFTVSIEHQGHTVHIGDIAEIKAMTIRGLIGRFEEATQAWRYMEEEKEHEEDTTSSASP